MADNGFNSTVQALFKGLEGFLTTKTVVGDAVKFDDGTIILPLVDVTFGAGAGAFSGHSADKGKTDGKNNAGGGMGGKIQPSAVLVIQNGQTKLVNIRDQDAVTKVLDMVPDAVNKVVSIIKGEDAEDKVDPEVESAVNKAAQAEASVVDVDGAGI